MTSKAKRRARLLRMTAAVVIVLGIFAADLVYWLESRSATVSNDPSLLTNEKEQARQEEILIGKQAGLVQGWIDSLKRPGTQAIIIVAGAAIIAGGCLYFAGLQKNFDEPDDNAEPPPG